MRAEPARSAIARADWAWRACPMRSVENGTFYEVRSTLPGTPLGDALTS